MKKTKVTIIIVTWNTSKITQRCIESINKFLPDSFAKIIVVDNGSTDSTEVDLKKRKDILYIRNDSHLGFSVANNRGAKIADTEFLYFVNSDMVFVDNNLINMIDYYQNNSVVGIIGPQFLNPDNTIQASVFPDQSLLNAIQEFWLKKPSYLKYVPASSTPTNVWSVSGGALLIKNSLFKTIGGWDEKYFMYYEDLDLCRRVRAQGRKIYYYPEAKIIHFHGMSGNKLAPASDQWKRLIPSSIKFHGQLKHFLLTCIIRIGQLIF